MNSRPPLTWQSHCSWCSVTGQHSALHREQNSPLGPQLRAELSIYLECEKADASRQFVKESIPSPGIGVEHGVEAGQGRCATATETKKGESLRNRLLRKQPERSGKMGILYLMRGTEVMPLTLWDRHFSQNSVTGFILTCTSALHMTATGNVTPTLKLSLLCF